MCSQWEAGASWRDWGQRKVGRWEMGDGRCEGWGFGLQGRGGRRWEGRGEGDGVRAVLLDGCGQMGLGWVVAVVVVLAGGE